MGTVRLRNPMHQPVRTLIYDEKKDKFVETTLHAKAIVDVPDKLSSLTLQQVQNGVLKQSAIVEEKAVAKDKK